jgi:hypothetical protein
MDEDRLPLRLLARCALRRYRPGGRAVLGAAAFALVLGLTLIRTGTDTTASGPPQPQAGQRSAARLPVPSPSGSPGHGSGKDGRTPAAHAPIAASRPGYVAIRSIGVDAPLTGVGLGPEGLLEVPPPQAANLAGWYEGAVTPGERGTAVVVGHVDNRAGPAVFFRLGALERGAEVDVRRKDGRTAVFTVYAVEAHSKEAFPGDRVYRDTGRAELRLITCGGGYAEDTGYQGNVVAYARLTAVR